jgi:hypothetical protein
MVCLVLLLLLTTGTTSATSLPDTDSFAPVFKPKLSVNSAAGSISVDGDLSDAGWQRASRIGSFVERNPGDMTKPEVETEAYMTYDSDKLYVAFVCHDDPALIRATMCERDRFNGDDAVVFLLDTYGDAAWAYEFFVNPYGVQKDQLWSAIGGEDGGFDIIWESAAKITPTGYTVEMAIPFSSLRFPNTEEQNWRVDFWRNRPRESYAQYSWAAYDRNEQCWVCQWGEVDGIKNVAPGKGLEIMPTFVSSQSSYYAGDGLNAGMDNEDIMGEPSMFAKYSPSSNVTVEGAINPDFSQIESDAAQIDVNTTFALFYPERRPFFQEGADIFRTPFNSFYSRMINDPEYAAKMTGRFGSKTIGVIAGYDENTPYIVPHNESSVQFEPGKSFVTVVRGLRNLGNRSHVGFMMNDRRFEGDGSNTIFALDGAYRLSRNYRINGQAIYTYTIEPDLPDAAPFGVPANTELGQDLLAWGRTQTFDDGSHNVNLDGEEYGGIAFVTGFSRNARNWGFYLGYNQIASTYMTQTGFDPVGNHRTANFWTGYTFYFADGLLERIQPQVFGTKRWDWAGPKRWETGGFALSNNLAAWQTFVGFQFEFRAEDWNGVDFRDIYTGQFDLSTTPRDWLDLGLMAKTGRVLVRNAGTVGNLSELSASVDLKPVDRFNIETDLDYSKATDRFVDGLEYWDGYIVRSRLRFQATRELSTRLIVQYNDFNQNWQIDQLLAYRRNSFSVLYAGTSYNYDELSEIVNPDSNPTEVRAWELTSRHFFVKVQYLFQM